MKAEIKHSCGHIHNRKLPDDILTAQNRKKWFETKLCINCFKKSTINETTIKEVKNTSEYFNISYSIDLLKKIQEETPVIFAEINTIPNFNNLPEIEGTLPEIQQATKIRNAKLYEIDVFIIEVKNKFKIGKNIDHELFLKDFKVYNDFIKQELLKQTSAKFWIENQYTKISDIKQQISFKNGYIKVLWREVEFRLDILEQQYNKTKLLFI